MQIKNILFPVDFSDCSLALNPEVEWLANRYGARVTLLHVFEIPISWYGSGEAPLMSPDCFAQFSEMAKKRLAAYPLNLPAARVDHWTVEGDAAWQIKTWVEEHTIDLVMMGTHGYGTMRRMLLGSVAMKVLHDIDTPVWAQSAASCVNAGDSFKVSNILCALELTEEALPLLRFTKELATDLGASVQLVHSVPETDSRPYKYFDMDLHGFLMKSASDNIERLQRVAETNFAVSLTAQPIGRYVATAASEQRAELVVIGRGRSRGVLGSLRTHSYDILKHAPCPVVSYSADSCSSFEVPFTSASELTNELSGVK